MVLKWLIRRLAASKGDKIVVRSTNQNVVALSSNVEQRTEISTTDDRIKTVETAVVTEASKPSILMDESSGEAEDVNEDVEADESEEDSDSEDDTFVGSFDFEGKKKRQGRIF